MRAPATLLFLIPLYACQNTAALDEALSSAVAATRTALSQKDHAALWNLTDAPTRSAIVDLLRQADKARNQVPTLWPEADRKAALEALGATLSERLGPDDDGRGVRLLEATLDLRNLVFNEDTDQGLLARDVTFEPGPPRRALIVTAAGERLAFVDDGGQWKSSFVRDLVLESAAFQALTEHIKKAQTLADEDARRWRESTDPKHPQGSYNLARAAQTRKPVDVDMLFALLDADARKTLVDLLESARAAQRQIQQKTVKAARRDAYRAAGLLELVDTSTDRELFKKWALGANATPLLAASDEPASLDGDPATGTTTVVTRSGGRVPMSRDPDGFWRMGALRPTLTAALSPKERAPAP
jgi:hypothetical protein